MNPLLHFAVVTARTQDNERRLHAAARHGSWTPSEAPRDPVTLRLDTVRDDTALVRLAALAGRCPAPHGRHVLAVVDGEVVAALPLSGGRAYADPSRRTAHLLPLLELRAAQLNGDRPRRRRFSAFGAARPAR